MGFLSKLFSHKSVEEVADEIANTYAEEVQAVMITKTYEISVINTHSALSSIYFTTQSSS